MLTSLPMQTYKESLGWRIRDAADRSDHDLLESLLRDPKLQPTDVNYQVVGDVAAPLYRAVSRGAVQCVRLLLGQPSVDVNIHWFDGSTPLHRAATAPESAGALEIMKLLCAHPDLNFDPLDYHNISPLWRACIHDNADSVRVLFAMAPVGSLNVNLRAATEDRWGGKMASEVTWNAETRQLLGHYSRDPAAVRFRLRRGHDLGLHLADIAADFATVVLRSDDYLHVAAGGDDNTQRYLTIVCLLPMELQMIMCHRRHGSVSQNILAHDTDEALKLLIRQKAYLTS